MHFETTGLTLFAVLSLLPALPPVLFAVRWFRRRTHAAARPFLLALLVSALVYLGVCVDAFLLEPNWPMLTELELPAPVAEPLTILHLSDLHLEADLPRREQWLIERLAALQPDLVLMTGDIHQTEQFEVAPLRGVLQHVQAPLGVYTCVGFDYVQVLHEAAPHIRVLQNEGVTLERGADRIGIAGLTDAGRHDGAFAAIAPTNLRIVLNHTPDLIEKAAAEGAHLYLCGHTHGGQVRIPLWGAIITNTGTGKRFEAGLYEVAGLYAYTSRGLGLEPAPAPPVRFFCRPEITLIRLVPVAAAPNKLPAGMVGVDMLLDV